MTPVLQFRTRSPLLLLGLVLEHPSQKLSTGILGNFVNEFYSAAKLLVRSNFGANPLHNLLRLLFCALDAGAQDNVSSRYLSRALLVVDRDDARVCDVGMA